MNVRMHANVWSQSQRLLVVAALAISLGLVSCARTRSADESASSDNVKETESRLLSVPLYTLADEQLLNRAGDGAALALTEIVAPTEMNSRETGRRMLLILHLAFENPQSIVDRRNRKPAAALRLLDQLEQTDYGRQPNVIANARLDIQRTASTGRPMQYVYLPGQSVIDREHTEWVESVLAWTATIKPGMTRTDLLRVFGEEGGLSTRQSRTYVLKQCPIIKVDVGFSEAADEADDKITQISRPYLAYEVLD